MAKTGDNTSPEGQLHYEENRHRYLITFFFLDSRAGIYCHEIGLLGDGQVLYLDSNICKRNQHFRKKLARPESDRSNPVALQSPRIVEQPVWCTSDRPRLSHNQNEQQIM